VSVNEPLPDPIPEAIAAIKASDQVKARALLEEVIAQDPDNDRAWQWMAIVVETAEEQRQCLHRALSINPNNKVAQEALERMAPPLISVVPAPPTVAIARPPSTALSESDQFLSRRSNAGSV